MAGSSWTPWGAARDAPAGAAGPGPGPVGGEAVCGGLGRLGLGFGSPQWPGLWS